jgi:hypothetical protein
MGETNHESVFVGVVFVIILGYDQEWFLDTLSSEILPKDEKEGLTPPLHPQTSSEDNAPFGFQGSAVHPLF